jgi:3-phenylpropionate/cinnamic acid dioxygenase small subunit
VDDRLRELLDLREIEALLARYASSLDARDWPRLASCFSDDAVVEYGGLLGPCEGPDAVVAACRSALEPLDASQHLIGTIEIELAGDVARAQCALQAQHVRRGCEGGSNFLIGGQYRDELTRTPRGWRIRRRTLVVSWQDGNPRVVAPGS